MNQKTNVPTEDILNEDERRIFASALEDVRKQGFGDIILSFRNGFIYHIRVVLDYHGEGKGKNGGKTS